MNVSTEPAPFEYVGFVPTFVTETYSSELITVFVAYTPLEGKSFSRTGIKFAVGKPRVLPLS